MTKRIGQLTSMLLASLLASSAAQAIAFSGTFTGLVTGSRINAQDPLHAGNIDGERATGTFTFNTDSSGLASWDIGIGPDSASFHDIGAGLTFHVHGLDESFTGGDGFSSDVYLSDDPSGQTLGASAANGPYWSANINFVGAPNSLFSNLDPATFNPLAVNVGASTAYFFAGRDFGGTVLLDGLTFDGYGAVGVPEPATLSLLLLGVGLIATFRRRTFTRAAA